MAKKELIVLVGPQGAGKSTYCRMKLADHVRISQDDQGKDGHMKIFKGMLEIGEPIVIDRINHTRKARAEYILAAQAKGYSTKIIIMNHPFDVCIERLKNRTVHPTLPAGSPNIADALNMYFSQYEMPTEDEADEIENLSYNAYDPYMQDLSYKYEVGKRFIVIGDVHGCYDEMMELLEKVQWNQLNDVIVFCGDLIDRGPKIKEVLKFFTSTMNVYSVMSNHEWKLFRHLKGNKVNVKNLDKTLAQCDHNTLFDFMGHMRELPYIVKFGKYHVLHAGMNPRFPIEKQSKEFLIYARKFNPTNNSFDDDNQPYWYTYPIKQDIHILFGHEIHEKEYAVAPHATALDGGCVFGNKLRGMVIEMNKESYVVEVDSKQPKEVHEEAFEHWSDPYEARVKLGLLSKQESDDGLVLYNYTDQCAYEKKWDKYTLECRGLIFEKETGKVIARPFSKFFNLGETESSLLQNLPQEDYECFEKMDGSLGIVFNYKGTWRVSTRGSFSSIQAKTAMELLDQYYVEDCHDHLTFLVEIIYPANRISPGARLVVDYGDKSFLCLLAIMNRDTGLELSRASVRHLSQITEMPMVKQYTHTIEEMIALQKTLPKDREGFVVRFASGFRIKIKGDEYCKMQKIINSITPLNLWALMEPDNKFMVPDSYLMTIPEEYRPEAIEIIGKLQDAAVDIMFELSSDLQKVEEAVKDLTNYKAIGLYLKDNHRQLKHPGVVFPYLRNGAKAVNAYVHKVIRPTNNLLKGD